MVRILSLLEVSLRHGLIHYFLGGGSPATRDKVGLAALHEQQVSSPVSMGEMILTASSSSERADWISQLDITNPDFYSVFDDHELQTYFKQPSPRIPIYVWDSPEPFSSAVKECLAKVPKEMRGQHEGEFNLYEHLLKSRHRVYNVDEALMHYVPFYMQACSGPYRNAMTEYVLNSSQYQRYGGSNFVFMWNHYIYCIPMGRESWEVFANGTTNFNLSKPLSFTGINYEAHIHQDFSHCHVMDPGEAQSQPLLIGQQTDIVDRRWPPYDETKYQNFSDYYLQNRHFNFIFVGQMDSRLAYSDRVKTALQCDKFAQPSVYIETSGATKLEGLTKVVNYTECRVPPDIESKETITCIHDEFPPRMEFDKLMMHSRYGWHHRGDLPNSGRLTDLFNTLTLPVITSPLLSETSNPYQCTIPYNALSFYVPPERLDHCDQIVEDIMSTPPLELEKKLRLLYYFRPYYVNSVLSWEGLLRETVTHCMSSSLIAEFNLSMSDFACRLQNTYKSQRLPRVIEADEEPVFRWT